MTVPGIFYLHHMIINNQLSFAQLSLIQTSRSRQMYMWSQPELCFTFWMGNMHMNARLFPREKEKPKFSFAEYGWSHRGNLYQK